MRKPLVAANWKMYGGIEMADNLVPGIVAATKGIGVDILLCPPAILISTVADLTYKTNLLLGGQNCYLATEGAYTGEISAQMLKDFSCRYVIIGHSERRRLFLEDDALVAKKFVAAQDAGLIPILCIGESLSDRERGETLKVVEAQLRAVLKLAPQEAFTKAIIAYEPVWAIGTGLTATPQQAQEVHSFIRSVFAQEDAKLAQQLRIIYGGSVKADNAAELFRQADIDGGLIGGASLKVEEFSAICKHAQQ